MECLVVLFLTLRPVDYQLMSNLQSHTATVQMLAKLCNLGHTTVACMSRETKLGLWLTELKVEVKVSAFL